MCYASRRFTPRSAKTFLDNSLAALVTETRMRWKLLIIAAFVAAFIGAGAVAAIAHLAAAPGREVGEAAPLSLLAPLSSITFASIFVYRHTARRRSVQAMATALLAGILTLAALLAGSMLTRGPIETAPTPAPASSNS